MRVIPVRNPNTNGHTAYCLEDHDLAVSKLAAFREKDRDFVRVLLIEKLVTARKLIARVRLLPVDTDKRARLVLWIDRTIGELSNTP